MMLVYGCGQTRRVNRHPCCGLGLKRVKASNSAYGIKGVPDGTVILPGIGRKAEAADVDDFKLMEALCNWKIFRILL